MYETTVYVVNGDDNNLTASVSVVLANTDEKPDRIIYKNEKKEEKPSDDSDSSEDDSDKSGGDSATGGGGSDRGQMISGDGAAKTGENNHWVIIAYFGACILLTAGAIVYVRISGKNRRPEDHE
ncbi:MAG: hypothetical protein K5879_04010 [Lachnospiraceae bacterium]|nr:hypothetical protein [Lachnospiraceae bacterium]